MYRRTLTLEINSFGSAILISRDDSLNRLRATAAIRPSHNSNSTRLCAKTAHHPPTATHLQSSHTTTRQALALISNTAVETFIYFYFLCASSVSVTCLQHLPALHS